MNKKILVIVESPTKARTIRKYLPSNYTVEASVGHVRDLPISAADIPAKYKGESWARLGINVEDNFKPLYITPRGKGTVVRELKKKLKEADELLLATDEDREGESISWHLIDILKPKVPVRRMVFHEITRSAIQHALEHGREVDMNLVNAQETRRILDRLYGFTLSPLIWKKIAYGLSAGRVQSPGLRLIVERERERISFVNSDYWDITVKAFPSKMDSSASFSAKLESIEGVRIAGGKDFNPETGTLYEKKNVRVLGKDDAEKLALTLKDKTWSVKSVQERKSKQNPAPPFTTSTLQQDGNRKLRMSARQTMQIAQRLYEQGFITYMRTDSTKLSNEGLQGARKTIQKLYGASYLSESPRQYSTKTKGAQEAHEAIRPAGEIFIHPDKTGLSGKELSLYTLIWKRTMATQMKASEKVSTIIKIGAGGTIFSATGMRIEFPGFLRVYVEGKDDPGAALDDKETFLPKMTEGDTITPLSIDPLTHKTKPPARYTEASLVSQLEKMGIGRPSTYAAIINTLFERQYIRKQGTSLIPTFTGFAVVQLLENYFHYLIEYSFTSEMENSLDAIALGKIDRLEYLKSFYLGKEGLKERVENRENEIKPDEARTIHLPHLGKVESIKVGKYGPYLVYEDIHASIPEEIAPADIRQTDIEEIIEMQKNGPVPLGKDPETEKNIYCLTGRYGPYFQLGEKTEEDQKPRRASLPKGKKPKEVTLEDALRQLSLPRLLGNHPDTGLPVYANEGRFGPYISHNEVSRSLRKGDDLFTVSLERALAILAEPKRGRGGNLLIKDFGKSGPAGEPVAIYDGRYGPYIKVGKKNIKLPEDKRDHELLKNLDGTAVLALIKNSVKK